MSSAGSFVTRFEREISRRLDVGHAAATTSGTAALHVALVALGIRPNEEVLVPSLTFIAPANVVSYVGARPVFVDVDPETWQIDPGLVARFLELDCKLRDGKLYNRESGRVVSAIIPVHVLGHPAEMTPLLEVARSFGLRIVEDATEALGARYRGREIGGLGDAGCLSFNGNKLITTGGGGMVVTSDESLVAKVRYLTTQAKDDSDEYVHDEIGYNYRLSNVASAIGCAQLETLDERLAGKTQIAYRYRSAFADLPGVSFMPKASWAEPTYWLSTILIDPSLADARTLVRRLAEAGVQSRRLWQPLHLSRAHAGAQHIGGHESERLYASAVSLPSSVGMSGSTQDYVIERVISLLTH